MKHNNNDNDNNDDDDDGPLGYIDPLGKSCSYITSLLEMISWHLALYYSCVQYIVSINALLSYFFLHSMSLAERKTAGKVKKFREAELKHGRLAMTAFLGIMTAESFNPL
mmetsp:Transcript_16203/g.15548  ORF Transcript_16203/g.15548 Transcript_16203/m.15548 type:complete len:110 (+) Transcript_16203:225-554(+)